jgi:molybdenum cofactor cytidylyltransferase
VIECVIPAAGEARRFGGCKAIAHLDGRPLITHVIERALTVCEGCVVVTGAYRDLVEGSVATFDRVRCVHNSRYSDGMVSSIAIGAAAVRTPWFFVAPADMPHLPLHVFRRLSECVAGSAARTRTDDPRAPLSFQPIHTGRPGHPVLISTAVVGELKREYAAFDSMRRFLDRYPRREIEFDDSGIIADIDTRTDLDRYS